MREYKFYIEDMKEAAFKILKYTDGFSYESFESDSKTYDSVLHNLLVIGESAARIPDEIREKNPHINWSGIIGMRNVIAHGYFSLDPQIIWETVKSRIPELKLQIENLK
ncbi:MAG TPA: DUF86 domain-containing protein [Spirochaetota bacterium]|nr:DUF86 domain-containing protein [Spirochaetota bacterium]